MDQQDDYELFLTLYHQNRSRLLVYIRTLLPHAADADDVFQRCSLLLWKKMDTYDRNRDFYNWASGVAFYEVKNFIRVANRDRLQFNDELLQELSEARCATGSGLELRLDALAECLESLTEKDRRLIEYVLCENGSLVAYATKAGRSLQSLYNRMSLLRRRIGHCIERRLLETEEGLP